jgi:hypothetical protein
MSDQENTTRGPKPLDILRDGALKVSIFRNHTERGENYAMVPGRIYTNQETGEVREATSLSGSEGLRMAHLLTKGHEKIREHRQQSKLTERKQDAPNQDRERER